MTKTCFQKRSPFLTREQVHCMPKIISIRIILFGFFILIMKDMYGFHIQA